MYSISYSSFVWDKLRVYIIKKYAFVMLWMNCLDWLCRKAICTFENFLEYFNNIITNLTDKNFVMKSNLF